MIHPRDLTQAQKEEIIRKVTARSLLETLEYHSLIVELVEHLIVRREQSVLKTIDELKEYPELLYFLSLQGMLPYDYEIRCYFHLKDVEVESSSKHRKSTVEDYMHNNIQLTLVYIRSNK